MRTQRCSFSSFLHPHSSLAVTRIYATISFVGSLQNIHLLFREHTQNQGVLSKIGKSFFSLYTIHHTPPPSSCFCDSSGFSSLFSVWLSKLRNRLPPVHPFRNLGKAIRSPSSQKPRAPSPPTLFLRYPLLHYTARGARRLQVARVASARHSFLGISCLHKLD